MSWAGDSYSQKINNTDADNQKKLRVIDQKLCKLHQLIQETKERLDLIRNRGSDLGPTEENREKIKHILMELPNDIDTLERSIPDQGMVVYAMKTKINEKRRDVINATKTFTSLCGEINTEIQKRQMQRNREMSMLNSVHDNKNGSIGSEQYQQQQQLDSAEIQLAMHEQEQSEQIARDLLVLEGLFTQVAGLIHEQGEKVDTIHGNVEQAYQDVDKGERQLQGAVGHKRSLTRKKLILIGIGIAVVAVLAIAIGLGVGLQKN